MDYKGYLILVTMASLAACGSDKNKENTPEIDTTAPEVVSISSNNRVLLNNETISIEFSESVDVESFELSSQKVDSEELQLEWSSNNTQLDITPNDIWPGGNSQINILVSDSSGNTIDSAYIAEINANLTFDPFQSADVIIENNDQNALFRPYGNQNITDGKLWIASCKKNSLYKFNNTPTNTTNKYDSVITTFETEDQPDGFLDCPQAPYIYNNQMIVTLLEGEQVVIYDSIPIEGENNHAITLGLSNNKRDKDKCSIGKLAYPEMAIMGGDKLIVADAGNHRVLVWNQLPTVTGQHPDLVIGQKDFESCEPNNGNDDETATSNSLNEPSGVWSDGTKLIIADSSNNRVLIWNTFPTDNHTSADIVLGQQDFTSKVIFDGDISSKTLRYPYEGVFSNGRQIFITDTNNNRVLIWNDWPTSNFAAADMVLGQNDFVSSDTQNHSNTFLGPSGIFISNSTVIVSDVYYSRLMLFKSR